MSVSQSSAASLILAEARLVANYASLIGLSSLHFTMRKPVRHLGALLADAVLQAGVNYETVVRMRVERIHAIYPQSSDMIGIMSVLADNKLPDYLLWNHNIKLGRFSDLATVIDKVGVKSTDDLKYWLNDPCSRKIMLNVNGIGPKTYDYISSLLGMDRIAVDRHLIRFAKLAGSSAKDYDSVQKVISFAADLLDVRRRDFDASIWHYLSAPKRARKIAAQFELPLDDLVSSFDGSLDTGRYF